MASGVKVHEDCKTEFDNMKLKHAYKYVIFRLSDDLKSIIVDSCGDKCQTYEQFIAKLKEAETAGQGRYAVYDCDYDKDKPQNSKLVFIMWNPDSNKTRAKMLYASSRQYLLSKLEGIERFQIQANEHSDLEWDVLVQACRKFDK